MKTNKNMSDIHRQYITIYPVDNITLYTSYVVYQFL